MFGLREILLHGEGEEFGEDDDSGVAGGAFTEIPVGTVAI
jgi:hypothetical protein